MTDHILPLSLVLLARRRVHLFPLLKVCALVHCELFIDDLWKLGVLFRNHITTRTAFVAVAVQSFLFCVEIKIFERTSCCSHSHLNAVCFTGVLPKYFSSEWSVAQFRLQEGLQYVVAFGHQKNTIVILGMDGRYFSNGSYPLFF